MIWVICRHEIRQQLRGKSLWLLLPLLVILTAVVALTHWQQQRAFNASQAHWQAVNDELWRSQPDRHPHRVAHYGSLVFREASPLSFIDTGVNPYVGSALYLEAHRQNSAALTQFGVSASQLRLGHASAATVVLVLLPLLLIAIGFNSVSAERESGRCRLLSTLGVQTHQLLLGKGAAYFAIALIYLCVLFAIAAFFVLPSNAQAVWSAMLWLFLLYAIYCLIWVGLVLAVSSVCANGAQSLTAQLGVWLLLVIVLPKAVPVVAERFYPHPDRALFEVQLHAALKKVGDSHNPNDPYFNAFREATLARYGVERVEDLPVNWNGLRMAEGERLTSEIFDQHYAQLQTTYAQQNTIANWAGLISPYLWALRLSERLSGTDAAAFHRFDQQAESYRYRLIQTLNQLHTEIIHHHNDKAQRASKDNWQRLPMFDYQASPAEPPGLLAFGAGALWWLAVLSVLLIVLVRARVIP